MSDAQLRRNKSVRVMSIAAMALVLISLGVIYCCNQQAPEYEMYLDEKAREESVRTQIDSAVARNNQLLAQIDSSGEELISFSEDKIKYINLASDLSLKHGVAITQLTVSDVWYENEMAGITTNIEIEGSLSEVREFLQEYCGVNNVNVIRSISCRPSGRYVWLERTIDGQQVLKWFDLDEDQEMYDALTAYDPPAYPELGADIIGDGMTEEFLASQYMYNAVTGRFEYIISGEEVPQEVLDATPISVEKMFAEQDVKVYLVIDFLGRA